MADPESCLKNALCTVSVHADSVWWHEAKDKYRLANLNLWLHVLRTRNQPAEPQLDYRHDRATYRCPRKPTKDVELPEELIPDPEAWLKGHSWPTAIARNFPAISVALVGEHVCRGFEKEKLNIPELLSEQNLPYKIETSEELKLYRRTCNESVRNIWLDLKADSNLNQRRRDSSPSVTMQDFCPPFLHMQRGGGTQPTYPGITDHNYQSELFPYHEHSGDQDHQWHLHNSPQQPHVTVYQQTPQSPAECFGEWRGRQASLLVLQRSSVQRPQRLQRFQQPALQQQFQPQPILLSSDFPELPNRGNEPPVPQSQMRRPFLPDPGNFTERRSAEMPELRAWLQTVYPQRAAEFSTMAALASRFEEVARRIVARQEVPPPQTDVQQLLVQAQTCREGRRLYRDVVASKVAQEEDSETNIDVKFEQLEREALEQYINSQNDNEEEPEIDISPEVEEKFLDLERQAIEQYEDQVELEKSGEVTGSEDVKVATFPVETEMIHSLTEPTLEHLEAEEDKSCSGFEQTSEDVLRELPPPVQEQPCSSRVGVELEPGEEAVPQQEPVRVVSLLAQHPLQQEERQKSKAAPPRAEVRHRSRKEPAPTPSCVRLPRRGVQEFRATGQDKCEKRYGTIAQRPSRTIPPSYQDRSCKKGQDNLRKTFYKKKEPSPEVRSKKRPPPLTVVDKEVKSLANCLRARALNFLKDVDVKIMTEEHWKVALRELLYKKQQKESIRKEIRVTDIQDTDTLRIYVREISGLARHHMQAVLKRVRDEVIDMTSRKTIFIAQPSTAEKRKVRYLIKKSLELMEKAESLKKHPKKPLESSKREISETLATIHKTMDAVYVLRDMCRETYEDMEYLKSSRETTVELVLGNCYLADKSDYIRRRVEMEKLPLLLYCLFPRRESILYDRTWAVLESKPHAIYLSSVQHLINNTLLISHQPTPWTVGLKEVRLMNRLTQDRPRRKELWSEDTWERSLVIGGQSRPVHLLFGGAPSVCDYEPLLSKKALLLRGIFEAKREQEPNIGLEEKIGDGPACPLKSPRKRRSGTRSDPELQSKQPALATDRGYWTWPKTHKTSNLLRLLKTQPKQRKKPLRNDSGCSLM